MTEATKLRLFVAVDVAKAALDAVEAATASLREKWPGARWTSRSNQHVTLKFLGWVNEPLVDTVAKVVSEVASAHHRAVLELDGLGVFPSPGRARVLWVGLDDPDGLLRSLAAGLDAAFGALGFEPESRAFTPHLTLARFRTPERVPRDALELDLPPARFDVEEIVLYRSHLSPKGPRYEALETFALGSPRGGAGA